MDVECPPATAKIYQFPTQRTAGPKGVRPRQPVTSGLPAMMIPAVDIGGAWYHGAAVQEATRTPKA